MGMPLQGLSPRVQNTEKADVGTQMFRIGSHLEQGRRRWLSNKRAKENLLFCQINGHQRYAER